MRAPAWPFEPPHPADVFEPGPEFHSLDGGVTWTPGPAPVVPARPDEPAFTVTKVDRRRGVITVETK